MSRGKYKLIDGVRYHADRPWNCKNCFWWKNKKVGCLLGEDNCYYLAEEPKKEPTPCDGCPYGRYKPCIGFCMKHILGQIEVAPGE